MDSMNKIFLLIMIGIVAVITVVGGYFISVPANVVPEPVYTNPAKITRDIAILSIELDMKIVDFNNDYTYQFNITNKESFNVSAYYTVWVQPEEYYNYTSVELSLANGTTILSGETIVCSIWFRLFPTETYRKGDFYMVEIWGERIE